MTLPPPVFLDLLPQNGSAFNVANSTEKVDITISGFLSEHGLIRLGNSVKQGPDFSFPVTLQPGPNTLSLFGIDDAGNSKEFILEYPVTISVPPPSLPLPPDPVLVATPVDKTVASILSTTTAFLYTGSNPIQTGVAPGTIVPKHAAVLRGKVINRDNTPLSGVKITVLNHPEFGQTLSRADGAFDMAVNGGGYLTVDYAKSGYLPAQRQLHTPWQDFAHADDVVMIALDSKVATVDLSANTMQVAQGNPVTDADGTRTATILFPAGTQATITLPDGSSQPLTTLHVRATEYTVGPNGPQAMPGALPPTSGYTYAVEMSVDEAVAAGAKDVRFNEPVPVYVDNFLNFRVGDSVPAGYYDRDKAAWIPSDNGRVIMILSSAGGMAEIDTNGDGVADDAAQLAALGISDAERIQLATLYTTAGKTLWRVPVTHFTPYDFNWPFALPLDAIPPRQPKHKNDKPEDEPDCQGGSIIECQNQILGERLPVTGVPFSLNYRSELKSKIVVPLSGASVPASLKRIDLDIRVAGRQYYQSFPAIPNQTHTFEWDGIDAYGRHLQGKQNIRIRIGYVYDNIIYKKPLASLRSFGGFGGATTLSFRTQIITLWQEAVDSIGVPITGSQGLGGWSASVHHNYDLSGKILYLGDGTRHSASTIGGVVSTVAGNGAQGFSGDGGAANIASVNRPSGVAIDAQGNMFIAAGTQIRKVSPEGIITTLEGFVGSYSLNYPRALTIDSKGFLYVADYGNNRILRMRPDGIIDIVAGSGINGDSGDGGQASAARLSYPQGIAVDSQDSLYIADTGNHRIRKVSQDGTITTVAGRFNYGNGGFSGDGYPATLALLFVPVSVAVDSQGNLYIADTANNRIRKVSTDGIITTLAGNGAFTYDGDGGVATFTALPSPYDITLDSQGNLFIESGYSIRKVSVDGIITTVAGNRARGFSGDGGSATAAMFNFPYGVATDPLGNLFIADYYNNRIRKVALPLPGFNGNDLLIPSTSGTQLYHFDSAGRHLRTLNTKTNAVIFSFAYDTAGRLIEITDGDGNKTLIERDSAGQPTAIVSANNQRTTLALDANGYLASVTNPAAEAYRMSYTTDGLLTRFTSPKGNASIMQYDASGRLSRDQNAANGFWALNRIDLATGYEASMTSAENRTTTYRVENLPTGDQRRTNFYPDGTQTINLTQPNGTTIFTAPDGTITASVDAPDPRFGMQASLPASTIIKTPSGLTSKVTATRTASLSNPNDPLSLVTQTDTVTVNGKTASTVYDAALKQTTVTSPGNRKILMTNDAQGRVLRTQVASLEPVNYVYDTRGHLSGVIQGSGVTARSFSYAYGDDGNLAGVTDALGRATLYQRDAAGRAAQTTLPGNRILGMRYDANGNPTAIIPPTRPDHAFTYTTVDRTEQITPPAVDGVIDPATRYAWSLDQNLTQTAYPDGTTLSFAYDAGGRLSSITPSAGAGTPITYGYAGNGQLAAITTPEAALSFGYDGSLPTQETLTGIISGTVSRGYNTDFRINQLTVNGVATAYAYDADGLLTGAGALALSRDPGHGALTGSTLGSLTTTQAYTPFGELASFGATYVGTPLLGIQLSYDQGGRITGKTETISGVTITYTYAYDAAGRLSSVSQNGSTTTWGYDANGNRTDVNGIALATVDAQDRLLSYGSTAYNYTANGSLSSKTDTTTAQTTSYTYDTLGNLKAVVFPGGGRIDYLVDGRNRRIGKKVNGTLIQGFIYQDSLRIAAELDGANNVVSRFTYGERPNVPELMVKGGNTYRILTDHLGSVRLVVDATTGAIAQRIDYDAWGQMTGDSHPGFQPFGYAGGLYDVDTRFTRFGARDYEAETGRWTAKDPIGFGGGDSNLYSYVGGNPISFTDPTGEITVGWGVALVTGAWLAYKYFDAVSTATQSAEAARNARLADQEDLDRVMAGGKSCPGPNSQDATQKALRDTAEVGKVGAELEFAPLTKMSSVLKALN